jgi:5-methylcytosine-specific restriction endonuclease McrA
VPYKDPKAHAEGRKAYFAAYQREHAAEHAASQRAYLQRKSPGPETPEAAEERRAGQRARWAERAGAINQRRKVRREAREDYAAKHAARQFRYKAAHPEVAHAYKARRRMRVVVAMTAQDRKESREWRRLIKEDPCYYCRADKTHHVDHYVSLANGGTDHWWNLVRACRRCNERKNALNGDEFAALLAREGALPSLEA